MQIIHLIDDFLYELFPETKGADTEKIIEVFTKYYTYKVYQPKVSIKDNIVVVDINTSAIADQLSDYSKAVALCEKRRFDEAKPLITKLIEKNPTNSEYHRILGQVLAEEGDYKDAIDVLIDALRWNPKNENALIMAGNIFSKSENDIETAIRYYNQVLVENPQNFYSLTNIGVNLLKNGNLDTAKKYLEDSLKVNPEYPNTHLALGKIAEMQDDNYVAFNYFITSLKHNKEKDYLWHKTYEHAVDISKRIIGTGIGKLVIDRVKNRLEKEGGKTIIITEDDTIQTTAKIEFAEIYKRNNHEVKYKPLTISYEHLIVHELTHLDFVLKARKEGLNQLFTSNQSHKKKFEDFIQPGINKLRKKGLLEDKIDGFVNSLFSGLNSQIYNAPIDLFIEHFIYTEFPEIHPHQFLSLQKIIEDGVYAVTDQKIVEIAPNNILSKSKILNICHAIQFRDLYGVDKVDDFKPTKAELQQANDFYNEFLEYKDDKEPAEEYELLQHWAEDLELDKYFNLVGEGEYISKPSDIDNILKSIEEDPFDLLNIDPAKEREMRNFMKSQTSENLNMSVIMYMIDAMGYFKNMPKEKIKKIAMDIAMQGAMGFNPKKKGYKIHSIPDKEFSGYHILAYYYVSWALALPEMLAELKMPYDKEYEVAYQAFNS